MATDFIIIDGQTPGQADVDINLNETVQLTSSVIAATYEWVLVSQPEGAPQVNLDPHAVGVPLLSTADTCTFTPTKEGSYLIRLTLNAGLPDESVDTTICAVRELQTGDRIPAPQETTEVNSDEGWAPGAVTKILQRVTRLSDSGIFVAQNASSGPLQPGSVVHMNGMAAIGTGDNERSVPTIGLALASDLALVDGPLGVMVGNTAGAPVAISDGHLCRVMVLGGLASYNMDDGPSGAGVAGDPVYVSNTGFLSLTAGTTVRQVGDVANVVSAGVYDIAISAGANSIPRGNALGDLSGMYPNPTVTGIQNNAVEVPDTGGHLAYYSGPVGGIKWGPVDLAYADSVTGTLPITRGGTGKSAASLTLNGLIYADTLTSMGVVTPGASGYLLKSNGAGFAPSWLNIVPISSGGTGANLITLNTGGFIYADTASAMACTAAGSIGQLIVSGNSGAPLLVGAGLGGPCA